jgi:hypothetical protein
MPKMLLIFNALLTAVEVPRDFFPIFLMSCDTRVPRDARPVHFERRTAAI